MKYSLSIQEEALVEIQDAFDWYQEQKEGLGYRLIEEIETSFEKICYQPENYFYVNERYRRIKVNRFPYLVVYEIEMNTVIVSSVRHTKQNPKY